MLGRNVKHARLGPALGTAGHALEPARKLEKFERKREKSNYLNLFGASGKKRSSLARQASPW